MKLKNSVTRSRELFRNIKKCALVTAVLISPLTITHDVVAETVITDVPLMQTSLQENQVNINLADAESLARKLKGIGLSKAQAIVAYRDEFGPFLNSKDLLKVKGIGQKTLSLFESQLMF